MSRPLTEDERALLDLLLTQEFPGRDALVEQAKTAHWGLFVDGGYLCEVEVYGYEDFAWVGLPMPDTVKLDDWVEVAPGSFPASAMTSS